MTEQADEKIKEIMTMDGFGALEDFLRAAIPGVSEASARAIFKNCVKG